MKEMLKAQLKKLYQCVQLTNKINKLVIRLVFKLEKSDYMKIGLYPGSFNPIHKGHIAIINKLLSAKLIDKIILIPLNSHPNKNIEKTINNRIEMLKIYESANILIDDNSKELYTYEIMDKYKNLYPKENLYYIIGSDNLNSIDRWKNSEEVLKNNFIIINRPEYNTLELINDKKLNKDNFTIINLNYDISSTMIRDKIKEKENIYEYLDKEVINYIIENKLYIE